MHTARKDPFESGCFIPEAGTSEGAAVPMLGQGYHREQGCSQRECGL